MRILNAEWTAAALPFEKLVPAVAEAAAQLARGEIAAPERLVVPLGEGGVLLCMPAVGGDIGITKLISVHPGNAGRKLPALQGEMTVFDKDDGRRLMMLDGPTVTARRTAAVTLLGVEILLPRLPESAVLIGSGTQARVHAEALHEFFGIRRFGVHSRDAANAQALCDHLALRYGAVDAVALDAAALTEACAASDLVIAATTSRAPVIPATLPAHVLAVGVGAFKPDMAEFPAALLQERPVVVDHLAGARHEAGDLLAAGIDWSRVRELPSIVAHGHASGPVLPAFKTVGHAAWDLAAARVALQAD